MTKSLLKSRRVLDSGRNYDPNLISEMFSLVTPEESLAVQSEKDETDINLLVKRFGVGPLSQMQVRRPTYGDFSGLDNYQDAMNALLAANESFMAMPSSVRERFHNNPAEFVAFCSDENNLDELREMGLADKIPDKEVTLADVVSALKETRYGDDGEVDQDAGVSAGASARNGPSDRAGAPGGPSGRSGPGQPGPGSPRGSGR